MSLRDYSVTRDKFEAAHTVNVRFAFPCHSCRYNAGSERDEPCRTCDHNINAEKDSK